ncbi:MAG: hypothetical protein VKN17_02400 [Cyanobacteriota bacterium]|jgi:hypothetical protein|nr:hypothetical protein [Synechococcus sp. FGCU3]MEB3104614.1 hypothetical protein [Cyanobacteriota bacterium]
MNPLPDRVLIVGLVATLGVVFALVFWFVKLQPARELPLQWRDGQSAQQRTWQSDALPASALT